MPVQLFSHNCQAYQAVCTMLEKNGKAAVIHPTGTGKSFIAMKWIEEHAQRFVWLSPSEYIYQTQIENVLRTAPDFPTERITFMTYTRLMMMTDAEIVALAPFGIVLDEFHRCGAKCWGEGVVRLLTAYPEAQLLGLSATKIRYLDGQRDMAEELLQGCVASEMTLGEAVVRGILPAPMYVTTLYQIQQELDDLQKRINTVSPETFRRESQHSMDALRETIENAEGLPAVFERYMKEKTGKYLVFCSSQTHMKRVLSHVKEWFGGIDPELHVYSAYSADPQTSRAFKTFIKDDSGHLKLLLSINMLNEGVHVRGVSGVILFRQTISPIIYKQQIGRALTAGMQNTPLILDVVNNFDSLSSYGTIQEEMDEAVDRLRREGRSDEIRTEKLVVIEQARDAVALFQKLENSLSTTWDAYYAAAENYFKQHGDLLIERKYVDSDGLHLGLWLWRQRRNKKLLSPGQVERLERIGIEWENYANAAWKKGYQHAEQFYRENGHLMPGSTYVCEDGYPLGSWIRRMRAQKSGGMALTNLTKKRVRELEKIGMVWNVCDEGWMNGYRQAKAYFEEHGDLNVPVRYKTETGFALGNWLSNQREAKEGESRSKKLTEEQIRQLESIGMVWKRSRDERWNDFYSAACEYYNKNGNLEVPPQYKTPDGFCLGMWIYDQKRNFKKGKLLNQERYARLVKIGMFETPAVSGN